MSTQHFEEDNGEVTLTMTFVNDVVAVGNFAAASNRLFLRQGRIKAIVGLTETLRGISPKSLGVRAIAVHPMEDGRGNTLADLREVVASITDLVKKHHRVLVHCHAGRSRSVVAVAAFLCKAYGFNPTTALMHIKSLRQTAIAPELEKLLKEFYNSDCMV